MFASLVSKLGTAVQFVFALSVLLSVQAQAQSIVGTWTDTDPQYAGDSYTFEANGRWSYSTTEPDFMGCPGPWIVYGSYTAAEGSISMTADSAPGLSFSSGVCVNLGIVPYPPVFLGSGSYSVSGTTLVIHLQGSEAGAIDLTLKRAPFVATTFSLITETSATISSTITFNEPDVGKEGSVFVTSWAPVAGLGALGISAAANGRLSVTSTLDNPNLAGATNGLRLTYGPLAELDASAFVLVQLTSTGWQLVTNGQLIPYASGVLGDALAAQSILNNANPSNLKGAQFCLGYGTNAAEMIAAERMLPIATIPDPNPAGTATGTCLITSMPVYRFVNVNTGGHFFTISQSERDDVLQNKTWFRSEGVGFNAFAAQAPGTLPIYRFYNTTGQGYFYTIYESEKDYVVQNLPAFAYEGIAFYAYPSTQPGTLPIYRFQNTWASAHFFTIYENEKDTVLQNYNWFLFEGVSFHAYPRQSLN